MKSVQSVSWMWAVAEVALREDLGQVDRELPVEAGGDHRRVVRAARVVVGVVQALAGGDEHHAVHAHLDVLDVLDVAVVHVGAGVDRQVAVVQGLARRHRQRRVGHAVEVGDLVGETVEVDRVAVEQVGPVAHAEVEQGQPQVLAGLGVEQRCRDLHVVLDVGHQ